MPSGLRCCMKPPCWFCHCCWSWDVLEASPPPPCAACCAFLCLEASCFWITSSDCWNSILRSQVPAVILDTLRSCSPFTCTLRAWSSSFGMVGSRFKALMRFISEIMPRFFLSSRAKPSPPGSDERLSRSRPWGMCDRGFCSSFFSFSRGTELNFASSSSSPSSLPSISECMLPLSISRAMRSALSRCSLGIALASSRVVYKSSLYVLDTPYSFSFAANWSQSLVPLEPPSSIPPLGAEDPSAQGTNSRPLPVALPPEMSVSVANPLLATAPALSPMSGGGTFEAAT
mmetsp:Transcript_37691/g.111893  ORF Transcript_37691/g.111893 Transcript_37691/m.111893 type:complete len:287 (+) Transcript_37691:1324-2184(+)